MKKKLLFIPICLLFSAFFFFACGENDTNTSTKEIEGTYKNGQAIIELEDGSELVGNEEISEYFSSVFVEGEDIAYDLMVYGENAADEAGDIPVAARLKLPYNYNVIVRAHRHFVGGCIKRNVFHINFIINKKGQKQPLTDLHVASWTQSGRVCAGIYITPQKWCKKICSPTFREIVDGIATALMYVGLSAAVAYALAYVLAPIAVGVLAL